MTDIVAKYNTQYNKPGDVWQQKKRLDIKRDRDPHKDLERCIYEAGLKPSDFKNFDDNTNFNEEDKKLFSKIHNFSKSKIEEVLKNDINVLNSLFKGTDEFEDPFCATWLLIKSKLTKTIPDPNDISVTKGSSGGRDCPPVVFKL